MHLRLMLALTVIGSGTALAQGNRTAGTTSAAPAGSPARPTPPVLSPPAGTSVLQPPSPETAEAVTTVAVGLAGLFKPSASYRIQYGDAIPNGLGEQLETTIHRLTIGLNAVVAEQWTFSYTPSLVWYTNKAFDDRVNHSVLAQGTGIAGDVDLGVSQSYTRSSDVLFETARMTKQEVWGTNGTASYRIGERTRLEVGASQYLRYATNATDSKTWQGQTGFRYRYSEFLSLAMNASSSYSAIDPGSDYTSQTLTANANWNPGPRLSLSVSGGGEFVRFKSGDAGTRSRPTYAANFRYQIADPTSISLNFGQSSGAAYFVNQYTESARIGLGVTQRFFGKLSLALSASEANIDYIRAVNSPSATSRSDRLRLYQAIMRLPLRNNLTVSLSLQRNRNSSNAPEFEVRGKIAGAELSWKF